MPGDNGAVIDYTSVLADLRARRADLDAAIAGIERMLGTSGTAQSQTPFEGAAADIQPDSFFGMSIVEGTKKFLAMKKRPQTTQEIADALIGGGMTHSSGNWGNTVGSVLNRNPDVIVRVKRGTWGLAAWYPNRRRPSQEKDKGDDEGNAAPEAGNE